MAICRAKKGRPGSPRHTPASGPPSSEATIAAASAGLTRSYSGPSGSTRTSGPSQQSRMHPTSTTWTRSRTPACAMAASRLSLTFIDPDPRQPAAVQQRIRTALRAERSFSAIAWRSARSIVGPSFHALQGRPTILIASDLAVVDHDGGQPAGAQATRRHERDLAVRRGLARDGPQTPLDGGQEPVGPLDVARGAGADDARVLPLGGEAEEVVKSCDAVDAAGGQLQGVRDVVEQVGLEVAEQLLRGVQHLDQRIGREPVPLQGRVEHPESVIAAGMAGLRRGHRTRPGCISHTSRWIRAIAGGVRGHAVSHRRLINHPMSTPTPSAMPRARAGSLVTYSLTRSLPSEIRWRAVAAQ